MCAGLSGLHLHIEGGPGRCGCGGVRGWNWLRLGFECSNWSHWNGYSLWLRCGLLGCCQRWLLWNDHSLMSRDRSRSWRRGNGTTRARWGPRLVGRAALQISQDARQGVDLCIQAGPTFLQGLASRISLLHFESTFIQWWRRREVPGARWDGTRIL